MTEFRLDPYLERYASRTRNMKSSEVRDLLAVTARPDMISFAGGLPDTRLFPVEKIVKATRNMMRLEGYAALQYGPSEGHVGLKEQIRVIMQDEGIEIEVDDFIVTDGAQQALDIVAKVFIDEGDSIIVEGPSYVGAVQAFSTYQPDFQAVPLDDDGLRVDVVEELVARLIKESKRPKFLYTVPNFHNPVGVTLSEERRLALLDISRRYDLVLIEDNPYGPLRFDGDDILSLRARDSKVIYISTFSKIFAPGIRLGWIAAPPPIVEKLIFAKQAANLCTNSFAQRVAEEYLRENRWRDHVEKIIEVYRRRRDVMIEALREYFPPEVSWTHPDGGLFIWATLPHYIDATEMLAEAIQEAKVAYVPGRAFYADGSGVNNMRLNFSYCDEERTYEGIKRLSKVIRKQMELYSFLTRGFSGESQKGDDSRP